MWDVIFIQIGSNIGAMDTDPLADFILNENLKGVLIEPVPKIFEQLKKIMQDKKDSTLRM